MLSVSYLSRFFCFSLALLFGFQWEKADAFGKSNKLLRNAATQGMPEACCHYGVWLAKQADKSEDESKKKQFYQSAFNCFKRAIDEGSRITELRANWAYMLEHGLGGEKNERAAFEIYKELMDEGFVPALLKVAVMTELGIGTDPNDALAEDYYQTACQKKLPKKLIGPIQYKRGMMYLNGWGVSQSEEEACICLESSAAKGFDLAKLMLLELGYSGRGKGSMTDACQGYKKMAASMSSWHPWVKEFAAGDLLYETAVLYKQDYKQEEMVKYYKKAARYGQPDALEMLGEIYKDAPIGLLSEAPCEAYQTRASYGLVYHPGHLHKQATMDCYAQFTLCLELLESKHYLEAVIFVLSSLINNGYHYAPAYFKLGQVYELGWGVPVNRKRARALYIEAAKLHYPAAQQKVSRYFKAESDIKKRLEQASVLGSLMDDIEALYKYRVCPLMEKELKIFKEEESSKSFDEGHQVSINPIETGVSRSKMIEDCNYIRRELRQLKVYLPVSSRMKLSRMEKNGIDSINEKMQRLEIAVGNVSIEEKVKRVKAFLAEGEIDSARVKQMLKGGKRCISLQESTAFEQALDKITENPNKGEEEL